MGNKDFKRWTMEEIGFLKKNWEEMNDMNLASHLGRSACTIQQRRYSLGLVRARKEKGSGYREQDWTSDDIAFIQTNWQKMSDAELAQKLHKKFASQEEKMCSRAKQMGGE